MARCDELRAKTPDKYTDESSLQCVACFENCGEECAALGSDPESYACPDTEAEPAGTGGAAGGG
jgi:hypothetical protein